MNLDRLAERPGHRIVGASLAGTALFAVTAVPAVAGLDALKLPAAVVSLVQFVVAIPLSLLASLALAVGTVSGEPFGVLQPVFPLALCAQWGARHGTFPRIPHPDTGPAARPGG